MKLGKELKERDDSNLRVRRVNLAPLMGLPLRKRPTTTEVAAPTTAKTGKARVSEAHHGCREEYSAAACIYEYKGRFQNFRKSSVEKWQSCEPA